MKTKKVIKMTALCIIAIMGVTIADGGRINIGSSKYGSRAQVMYRIYQLEKTVYRMQDHMQQMQDQLYQAQEAQPTYTCYLDTTFDGMFQKTSSNMTKAKVNVRQQCLKKTNNTWSCKMSKIKCGQ